MVILWVLGVCEVDYPPSTLPRSEFLSFGLEWKCFFKKVMLMFYA